MTTSKAAIYLILFTILIVNPSWKSGQEATTENSQDEDIYINQFKLRYFRELLLESYNNSNAVQEIISNDHSGFAEPILTEDDTKLIDSLTFIDNQKLIADSSESHLRAEGAQGKRPLGYIMKTIAGSWLDSLAKQRCKISGFSSDRGN